jgi:uncharacterized OB-fold protein
MAWLEPQAGPIPPTPRRALTEPFWAGCAERELRHTRCPACGRADFPPAEHCRWCLAAEPVWETGPGLGHVYSYTVVWRQVTRDFRTPYAPAIVELDEGHRMLTNLVGLDADRLRVGLRVRVSWQQVADDLVLPYFAPHEEPA